MMLIFLLFLTGLIFIFLEFFLPGFVLAVIGSLALLASVALVFIHYSLAWGCFSLVPVLLSIWGVCQLALWQLKKSKIRGDFYHDQDQEGFLATSFDSGLIGKEGTVFTELKPAGHILVDGQIHQALSETGFISKGEKIKIVGGKGSHFIVRGD